MIINDNKQSVKNEGKSIHPQGMVRYEFIIMMCTYSFVIKNEVLRDIEFDRITCQIWCPFFVEKGEVYENNKKTIN